MLEETLRKNHLRTNVNTPILGLLTISKIFKFNCEVLLCNIFAPFFFLRREVKFLLNLIN